MDAETRAGAPELDSERAAYDEGVVFERSAGWNRRVPHVFHAPNTERGEALFVQLIAEAVQSGGRVLDAGCGTGETARQAVERGASKVLAADLSERFLREARRRGDGDGRIEYRLHDLHRPLDGRFDLVVGRSVLHHIDWRSFLQRTYSENLAPAGRMVFMEPMSHPMTIAFHRLVRSAHTPGEYPLSRSDVDWLEQTFPHCGVHPINFLSFPAGVLSSYLFRSADNSLTRTTDAIDRRLERRGGLRGYARQAIIVIDKPSSVGDSPRAHNVGARGQRDAPMTVLSVVTPVRNMARYLPHTLDGVAALRTSHQHIVVDGASDDGTVELLERREDPHLVWISESDSGQTEAVNKGLRLADGDLLAWVNADDAYIPEAVDRALDHLARNPATGAVFGAVNYVDESGRIFRTLVPPKFSWRRYLYFGAFVTTPTIIWRRELLEQAPSLNKAYVDAADYDFYLRLLRGVRVDRIDEPLLNFRYHPTSKTTQDVWVQLNEAKRIRLGWAGNPMQRGIMRSWEGARRAILPRISSWPHPEPRGVVKLLRRIGARG